MFKIDLSDFKLRSLPVLLKLQAEQNPQTIFLKTESVSISYSEAHTKCLALASSLSALGVGKGDHVVLYTHNCAEMVLAALATNILGAVWVPISTDYKGEWLREAIARSRPKILISEGSLIQRLEQKFLDEQTCKVVSIDANPNDLNSDAGESNSIIDFNSLFDSPAFQADYQDYCYGDTCAIVWTSGTTGKSKGVMVSHNGWLRPIYQGTSVFYDSQVGDIIYNVLPMYHAGAWNTSILRALCEGITVVIEQKFSVTNFWQRIEKFGATQSFTLGAMHMFLWNAPETADDANNSLRVLQAIPIPKNLVEPFERRFGLRLAGAGFGQSECMMITTEAGAVEPIPDNSIGFACADTLVAVFDENDQEVAIGSIGEMRIKPLEPHIICNGYLDNPQAYQAAWRGEWFCTGDLGHCDSNGAFFFSDRKKDSVRFAGRNISTMEVEAVVRQHASVADVAAYGIPSKELESEDELKIDIVLKDGESPDYNDIAKFINHNAPHYFVPRYMNFLAQLPYTPTNKVQKFLLREKGVIKDTWDLRSSEYQVQK